MIAGKYAYRYWWAGWVFYEAHLASVERRWMAHEKRNGKDGESYMFAPAESDLREGVRQYNKLTKAG